MTVPLRVWLLVGNIAGFLSPSYGSGAANETEHEGLCCFNPEKDVKFIWMKDEFVMVVDNALCPDALGNMLDVISASHKAGQWDEKSELLSVLPSNRAYICTGKTAIPKHMWRGDAKTRKDLCTGGLAFCAKKAVESVQATGEAKQGAKKRLQLLRDDLERESRNKKQNDVLFVNAWYSKAPQHPIHFDGGMISFNFHLNDGFNGTGTAFWQTKKDKCMYITQATPKQLKRFKKYGDPPPCSGSFQGLPDGVTRHFLQEIKEMAAKAGKPPPLTSFLHEEEPYGRFEIKQKIDYVKNRMVVYTGHLFHSPWVSPEAVPKLNSDPTKGRLTLNQFLRLERLQKELVAVGEDEDSTSQADDLGTKKKRRRRKKANKEDL